MSKDFEVRVIDGTEFKVPFRWKLVQVSGEDKVAVVAYNKDDNRVITSTPLCRAKGNMVQTESGSHYLLLKEYIHPSMWQVGLQLKRPEVYKKLVDCGVL